MSTENFEISKVSFLDVSVRVLYLTDEDKAKNKYAGRLLCTICGKVMDWVTDEEIEALKTGEYGVSVCAKCEPYTCIGCGLHVRSKSWRKRLQGQGGRCVCCDWESRGYYLPALLLSLRRKARLSSILITQGEQQDTAGQSEGKVGNNE